MYGKNSMGMKKAKGMAKGGAVKKKAKGMAMGGAVKKKAKGMAMGGAVKGNMTVAQAKSFLKGKGFKVEKA